MAPMADFSLEIEAERSGEMLAAKTWNALWLFHLLALACRRPVIPLYTAARYGNPRFGLANRNLVIRALAPVTLATTLELDWARDHAGTFDAPTRVDRFSRAMRAYGNAHYLFDDDAKIMLLWAGIEGLLGLDAELRRRFSLHAPSCMTAQRRPRPPTSTGSRRVTTSDRRWSTARASRGRFSGRAMSWPTKSWWACCGRSSCSGVFQTRPSSMTLPPRRPFEGSIVNHVGAANSRFRLPDGEKLQPFECVGKNWWMRQ
jgi:hypothetical protein